MKKQRIFLLSLVICSLGLGCVNIEKEKRPIAWPQLTSVVDLHDLEGVYKNHGRKTLSADPDFHMGELWYFLTRQIVSSCCDDRVRITLIDSSMLKVELIDSDYRSKGTTNLKKYSDFSVRHGTILLPPESGFSAGALGAGVWTGSCRLHITDRGGLVGEKKGVATGLVFHVIPGVGFGNDWCFWERID